MTVFDGISDGLWQGNGEAKMANTMRGQEGDARSGNTTTRRRDERKSERCNKRMTRDDAKTSWRNEMMRECVC